MGLVTRRSAIARLGTLALGMLWAPRRLAAGTAASAAAGKVTGTVTYAGKAPRRQRIKPTQDIAVCGRHAIYDEALIVAKQGGLANAVVAVEVGKQATRPTTIHLDQVSCIFVPHVLATSVGSSLRITNSDPVLNSPHAYMGKRTLFNIAQPLEGMEHKRKLKKPGLVKMICDVHQWESAYIKVFDHSCFAVTDSNGAFTVANIPAGTYPVTVWHEKLGEKRGEVTIAAGATAQLDLAY